MIRFDRFLIVSLAAVSCFASVEGDMKPAAFTESKPEQKTLYTRIFHIPQIFANSIRELYPLELYYLLFVAPFQFWFEVLCSLPCKLYDMYQLTNFKASTKVNQSPAIRGAEASDEKEKLK